MNTEPKKYPLFLTQQEYSDIMVALAKIQADFSFLPMLYLHSQMNSQIVADLNAAQEKPEPAPKKTKKQK